MSLSSNDLKRHANVAAHGDHHRVQSSPMATQRTSALHEHQTLMLALRSFVEQELSRMYSIPTTLDSPGHHSPHKGPTDPLHGHSSGPAESRSAGSSSNALTSPVSPAADSFNQRMCKEKQLYAKKILNSADHQTLKCYATVDPLCDGCSCLEEVVMPLARMLASDDRDLYEKRGLDLSIWRRPFAVSRWNEQLAFKIARKFGQSYVSINAGPNAEALSADFCNRFESALSAHAQLLLPKLTPSASATPAPSIVHVSPFAAVRETGAVASGDGQLILVEPCPAFTPLLEVSLDRLFYIDTIKQRCTLAQELITKWKSTVPDEETVLTLALLYEYFVVGTENSSWKELLARLPTRFPTFPLHWGSAELGALTGTGLAEVLTEKEEKLKQFTSHVHQLVSLVLLQLPKGGLGRCRSYAEAVEQFSEANIRWAQSVFDSRALHLNFDGTVHLVLAPDVDMINHNSSTHILTRRIDTQAHKLILETGAELSSAWVGQQLYFTYGPLQTFEQLLSYGFIDMSGTDAAVGAEGVEVVGKRSTDQDSSSGLPQGTAECVEGVNPYDRFPFPFDVLTALQEPCLVDGVDYKEWRQNLANAQNVFLPECGELWIPVSGVPPPTLLALIRLLQADVNNFHLLELDIFGGSLDARSLEEGVVETVELMVQSVLDEIPVSYEESLRQLAAWREECNTQRQSGTSANATTNSTAENMVNAILLRMRLLSIGRRALEWCSLRRAELKKSPL
jgi:hypothetical protein